MVEKKTKKIKKVKGSKTASKSKKTKPKTAKSTKKTKKTSKSSKKTKEQSFDDMGIVIVEDDLTIDKDKVNEERRAYLEEARSQEAYD